MRVYQEAKHDQQDSLKKECRAYTGCVGDMLDRKTSSCQFVLYAVRIAA
jgi:hypothetical protein